MLRCLSEKLSNRNGAVNARKKTSGKKQPHKTERNRNITQRRRAVGKQAIRGGDRCCVGNDGAQKKFRVLLAKSAGLSRVEEPNTGVCLCGEATIILDSVH